MKSILYVGAALMIGASIYGFVDYKQTSNKKEFTNMYEAPEKKPALVTEKETTLPEPIVTAEIKKINAPVTKKFPAKTEPAPAVKATTVAVTEETKITEKPVVKKTAKKRKLNHRLFSRAPLREEEEVIAEPVKDEVKKAENKEQ